MSRRSCRSEPSDALTSRDLSPSSKARPYNRPAMNVTASPAPKSSVQLEVELPPERLARAVDDAVRRLARRTRVPGFRPGKAPRFMLDRVLGPGTVLEEAVEHLVQDAYRDALIEKEIV